MSKHLVRQYDLVPMSCLGTPITIIGAGATGSWAALALAKMGFQDITSIDFDVVAVENMNCQLFRFKDIGRSKVLALRDIVEDFTGTRIQPIHCKYEGKESFDGIVVSALDSMSGRKAIWEAHLDSPSTIAVVDPRMGSEQALFYAMRPMVEKDRDAYPKTLYTDDEAVMEPCTGRAVAYTAMMISGLIAKTVKELAAGQKYTRTATWNIRSSTMTAWKQEWNETEQTAIPVEIS